MSISRAREQPTGKSRVMHIYGWTGTRRGGGGLQHVGPENHPVILFTYVLFLITFINDKSFGLVGIG